MTEPVHGLPPLISAGLRVAAVPPELRESRWLCVAEASEATPGQLVAFKGIRGLEDSSRLVGKTLLAAVEDLPEELVLIDADALIGRVVHDEKRGLVGTIAEVMIGTAQDVWVLDGPFGELLVPAAKELFVEIHPEGPIVMRLPEGILPAEQEGTSHAH